MLSIDNSKINTEIFFFTNSELCKQLTIDIITLWKDQQTSNNLSVIDFSNNMITNFSGIQQYHKTITNKDLVNEMSLKLNITSYPCFCIYRNGKCIETISGNYTDLKRIINNYL